MSRSTTTQAGEFSVCSLMHPNCEVECLVCCAALLGICRVWRSVSEEVTSPFLLGLGLSLASLEQPMVHVWGMHLVRTAPATLWKGPGSHVRKSGPAGTTVCPLSICECAILLRDSSPYGTFWAQGTLHGRIKACLGFTYAYQPDV